jgi:hypothetical protein
VVNPRVRNPSVMRGDVRAIREADLPALCDLDRQVFGADRTSLLIRLVKELPELVFVLCRAGRLSGACAARTGSNYTQIGPVIAESLAGAQSLVIAAMNHLAGQPAVMDVPDSQSEFGRWLSEVGFAPQRPLWRMFHGQSRPAGDCSRQFAIAGPDLG